MSRSIPLFKFIFILIIYSNDVTSEMIKDNLLKLSALNESIRENHNETKLTVINEGGSVLPNSVTDDKSKDKLDILLSLDSEMGKTKQKPIKPRKGVNSSQEDMLNLPNPTNEKNKTSNTQENHVSQMLNDINKIKNITVLENKNHTKISDSLLGNAAKISPINSTQVPKKPLILSSEVLDKMTVTESDQIYLTENHITKVPKNPNSHPGMIMPIVITMLVVPMFAVVGYLAVKRGQEAWKNRHYKRMDFLLDGMYND